MWGTYLEHDFTKPDKVYRGTGPSGNTSSTEASLSLDRWWQGCRAQRTRAHHPSLGSLFCCLFGPQSCTASLPCHLLAKAGSKQVTVSEDPAPRLQVAALPAAPEESRVHLECTLQRQHPQTVDHYGQTPAQTLPKKVALAEARISFLCCCISLLTFPFVLPLLSV